MYYEREIDAVARACIRMLKAATGTEALPEHYHRIRDEETQDGEGAAIFGATLAALCAQVAPGYTSKQGEWWNVALPLLADALRACDAFGFPDWQAAGVERLREFVRDHQLDGDWSRPEDQLSATPSGPDQHKHIVAGGGRRPEKGEPYEVAAFQVVADSGRYWTCGFAGCEG